jgi:hypothetical protein
MLFSIWALIATHLLHLVLAFKIESPKTPFKTETLMSYGEDGPIRGIEWARKRGMEPGYGGIWPGNPNAKKYSVTIKSKSDSTEYTLQVPSDRYIYFYFEENGINLPIPNIQRMCRQVVHFKYYLYRVYFKHFRAVVQYAPPKLSRET